MKGRSGPARTAARIVGDSHARKLLPLQAFHSAGEALFGLSLVGSLFFNVSVDAARPRILLYLAVTMAPFAIIGPLIGPVIDQVRFGHRGVLALSLGARSVVALLLASQLQSLLLYPEAFVIVVLAKVFAVSRNALVPVLVGDRDHLVVVNARLARVAAIAGGLGAAAGVGVLRLADAGAVLRLGAAMYLVGALFALRIPAPHPEQNASPIIEVTEMHGPGVQLATTAMIAVRSAVGFSLFHIGFSLKSVGEPAWVLGLVAAGGSVGSFVGTYVAPRLRRRVDEQSMLTVGLLVATVFAFVAALRVHGVTAFLLTFALGTGGSVGRRAFDGVVQTEAPHARRGQAYAGLETRLELAWVGGAIVAVITRTPAWVGLAGLTVGLGAV
ncbi:MAG: hypothetical protein OEY23_14115, partial [Acidimicrobiia bacterium]|nr:hypothetical protein [Acidimicrobiia bacterium]